MLLQEQIEFFHANGYLIMRGLFEGRELQLLREAVDRVQAEGMAGKGEAHLYFDNPDGTKSYRRSERMWGRGDIFRAVTVKPELLENIGQCVGQAFFPWNDSLVVKVPFSGAPVHWHQDPPYGDAKRATTFAVPNFTTDIYLDYSGTDNGCVWAIPGHHLVGNVDLKSRKSEELYHEGVATPLVMEAGDVLFHSLSLPHGSQPNHSAKQRRIFYIHYVSEDVYQDGYGHLDWAKQKPGWNAERKALIESMSEKRAGFGWETFEKRGTLKFGEGGFEFVGKPNSPRRYWETAAGKIPAEKREAMKSLKSLAAR